MIEPFRRNDLAFEINRIAVHTSINNNLVQVAKMVLEPFQLGIFTTVGPVVSSNFWTTGLSTGHYGTLRNFDHFPLPRSRLQGREPSNFRQHLHARYYVSGVPGIELTTLGYNAAEIYRHFNRVHCNNQSSQCIKFRVGL
jgi:hypothetical protein